MADDVAITPGSGAVIATDDIGGRHFQRVKIAWGADGSASDVSATSPLPAETVYRTTLRASAVSVGTSATALPATALSGRRLVVVRNAGSVTVYLGASDVTTTAGWPLEPGWSLQLALGAELAIYGIVASGSGAVRVLEVG